MNGEKIQQAKSTIYHQRVTLCPTQGRTLPKWGVWQHEWIVANHFDTVIYNSLVQGKPTGHYGFAS